MEKKQYDLCLEVLRRFHKHKLLSEFILVGSWCVVFYEKYFLNPELIRRVSLVTRDMDFLIERPQSVKIAVDIPELLKDLGFIAVFKGREGYMKLDHPELILEFLTPERGRGRDTPQPLPSLHVNATALRFLNFLSERVIKVNIEGFTLQLPHPANFGLHKLIVSGRRPKKEKAIKDQDAAIAVLQALVQNKQGKSIANAYDAIPKKWQAQVTKALQQTGDIEILKILQK